VLEALIVTCGHETTSSAIGGGLLALLEQRDQLEMLQANPELIDNAADELIRFRPAGQRCQPPTCGRSGHCSCVSAAAKGRERPGP